MISIYDTDKDRKAVISEKLYDDEYKHIHKFQNLKKK